MSRFTIVCLTLLVLACLALIAWLTYHPSAFSEWVVLLLLLLVLRIVDKLMASSAS